MSIMLISELYEAAHTRNMTTADLMHTYGSFTQERFEQAASDEAALPLVIPVRDDQDLPYTLLTAARSERPVIPVVVDNGSERHPAAETVKAMGGHLITLTKASKVTATHTGLDFATEELQARQILFTDGDTLLPRRWAGAMAARLGELCTDAGGLLYGNFLLAHGESRAVDTLRTLKIALSNYRYQKKGGVGFVTGANYALAPDRDGVIRAEIEKTDPQVFMGDDAALRDAVLAAGGAVGVHRGLAVSVWTRGDRATSLRDILAPADQRFSKRHDSYRQQYGDVQRYTQSSSSL